MKSTRKKYLEYIMKTNPTLKIYILSAGPCTLTKQPNNHVINKLIVQGILLSGSPNSWLMMTTQTHCQGSRTVD